MQNTDEIEKLYHRIVSLHKDIDTLRQPLLDIKSVITEIKKIVDLPGTVAKDLKKLRTLVSALNEVVQLLEWVPGQLGTTCKAVHRLLSPLVEPATKGVLDELINTTEQMDKAMTKIKQYLEKVEPYIDKSLKAINGVRDEVIALELKMAELVEHYKRIAPSAETIECVRTINRYIDQLEGVVLKLKAQFESAIQPLSAVLSQIRKALDPIAALAEQITHVLKQIDIKAINDLIRQVNQYKKKIQDFRKKVVSKIEAVVRAAFKKFGIDIDAIDKLISKLINSALKPLRHVIDDITAKVTNMLSQISTMLEKLLPLDQLNQIVSAVESLRDDLQRELDRIAGSACRSVLRA
ncbi:MAG: hypothetical protein OQL27_02255 [Sedimenticola sp.]|nr:hypothetical protein [Sedimenticola sp.]